MKNLLNSARLILPVILAAFILFGCQGNGDKRSKSTFHKDLEEIKKDGVLRVVTSYSPVSYFIYRGQPMGYEYELLKHLSEYLEIELELSVARDFDEMIAILDRGDVDLIAYNLTVTRDRRELVNFTVPLNTTRQVLVQRKPNNWRQMQLHKIEQQLIRNPIELAGKEVHVRRASSYLERLYNLESEIGEPINVIEADAGYTTEQLIRMVAEREIDYTVSDENIARLNQGYFPILDVKTAISLPQQTAWAVRKSSEVLLESLNEWLDDFQTKSDYYVIYNKYFENRRAYSVRIDSDLMFSTGGQISLYDEFIIKYSEELGWDWLLIASQIYQESQFNPDATSWAGARGLMQLMPRTAQAYGATDPSDPEQSIKAGIAFLKWLDDYWSDKIEDNQERVKFILASYNVGQGHVQDARRLAEKYGANPNVWDGNVEVYMQKKSREEYYNDEVVRFGYARGLEPVRYVSNILYIYNHYKSMAEIRDIRPEEAPIVTE